MRCHCTKMYPMAWMCLSPLSRWSAALFPHERYPTVPNPIIELQVKQSFCWLAMMPILALKKRGRSLTALNPSLLQFCCKEACGPTTFFHVSRPNKVARYFPSAINEYKDFAVLLIKMNLSCCPIFIPRQILEKGVFQLVTLFPVSRSHSCRQHCYRSFCSPRNGTSNGRCTEIVEKEFSNLNIASIIACFRLRVIKYAWGTLGCSSSKDDFWRLLRKPQLILAPTFCSLQCWPVSSINLQMNLYFVDDKILIF